MNKYCVLESMALAAAAYCDSPPAPRRGEQTFYSAPNGVQFITRRWGDCLSITFRGSNSPLDWAHNLAFAQMSIPYDNTASPIRVHKGFLYGYKSPHVRGVIHGLMHGATRVRISGHSYGAALATLCAVDVQYNFPAADLEVFLFGCPRVGNRAFAQSYNKRVVKTLRVENGNDIVTKVPLRLMGYCHVGCRYHIGFPRLPFAMSALDHYPKAYYQWLARRLLP